jgi:hypothetical protein
VGSDSLLKAGDSFSCNLSWTMTQFESNGKMAPDLKAKLKTLVKISAIEIEVTTLYESDISPSMVAHPISAQDGRSVYAPYTDKNGDGVKHLATLHALDEAKAIFADAADAYRNQAGGVVVGSENGLCVKIRR